MADSCNDVRPHAGYGRDNTRIVPLGGAHCPSIGTLRFFDRAGARRFLTTLQRMNDMRMDAARFPLVWMRTASPGETPAASPFAEFEALLARKEAFVLLNDERLDAGAEAQSPVERKQISLWMKLHRSDLQAFVRASIHIEPSATRRLASKAFAALYGKFWGYPMLMASTRQEALLLAGKLLADEPAQPVSR